jgi:hypothetical protein
MIVESLYIVLDILMVIYIGELARKENKSLLFVLAAIIWWNIIILPTFFIIKFWGSIGK